MKVLFAASEAYPLVKTGGLGDVANALPNALTGLGLDVRVVLPAYPAVRDAVEDVQRVDDVVLPPFGRLGILACRHPAFECTIRLVESEPLFSRAGNPYVDGDGVAWDDNARRFAAFSHAVALLATGELDSGWSADVLHLNDWQTGMAAALVSSGPNPPCTVFTIHNVTYDCLFDRTMFDEFRLPADWWSVDGGEYYQHFSMLKSGIVYSDRITAVSPRYAEEICTPEFGYGYAGILSAHRSKLLGILNGVDTKVWNPVTDPWLVSNYGSGKDMARSKRANRERLLGLLGAAPSFRDAAGPLVGFVGRLVPQKGVDLLLDAIPDAAARTDMRFVVIGAGDHLLEARLDELTRKWPERVTSYIGYSEQLAHLLEAGCDLFAMPSRFEPCGLNQMYSMLYGTPPVVHGTGGLADTVVDANERTLADGSANGFVFDEASAAALSDTLVRAVKIIANASSQRRLVKTGMSSDFGWDVSARRYQDLYRVCAFRHGSTETL